MLLEREKSCLLLIDVQEKLTPLVQNSKVLVERCEWLMRLARDLKVPILASEQYPKGLGGLLQPLKALVSPEKLVDKVHFSCLSALDIHLQALNKKQLLLIGIEAHVCILQSALELTKDGYEVFVVVDAVSSRAELDYQYGLKRMKQQGVNLVTSEMVFFEWIGQAGTAEFKAMSQAYLK